MATKDHPPTELSTLVDCQATENGARHNRYVVRALENKIGRKMGWSRRFLNALAEAREDTESHKALDDMMQLRASLD